MSSHEKWKWWILQELAHVKYCMHSQECISTSNDLSNGWPTIPVIVLDVWAIMTLNSCRLFAFDEWTATLTNWYQSSVVSLETRQPQREALMKTTTINASI